MLGDINDGQASNTANILTEQPRFLVGGSTGGSDVGLYTAQTLQEYRDTRDVYYTHVHQDLRESLDHVLVSEQFYDNSRRRLWLFDGLVINNDHLELRQPQGNRHRRPRRGQGELRVQPRVSYTATRSSACTAGRRISAGRSEVDRPSIVASSARIVGDHTAGDHRRVLRA